MDILDRYLGYEAWTLRYFITRCRDITPSQLHQPFDIGHGSVHATVDHMISNLEIWTDLMRKRDVRHFPSLAATPDSYLQRLDDAMADFADCACMLVAEDCLDETYIDVLDTPPTSKTFGGTILHVLTHTTMHRWELQHMLQRLGIPDLLEGDALSWEMTHRLA